MDLLRRRAVAGRRHVVVQPAHVDDEAHARRSRIEAARPSRAASLGDLPAAAVRADDAQPRVAESRQLSAVGYQPSAPYHSLLACLTFCRKNPILAFLRLCPESPQTLTGDVRHGVSDSSALRCKL